MLDLSVFANNNNQIGSICRDGNEYIFEINTWHGATVRFKTKDCRCLSHKIYLGDEIGDIEQEQYVVRFKTMDIGDGCADVILEIKAEDLIRLN